MLWLDLPASSSTDRFIMRSNTLPFLLVGILALAACGDSAPEYSAANSPKHNRIVAVKQEHAVRFAHGSSSIDPGEASRLTNFLAAQGGQADGHATVLIGPGTGPSGVAFGRERTLRELLASRGYRQVDVAHTGVDTGGANGVTIAVSSFVVVTPRCPDHSKPSEVNYTNTLPSNFGCADAHNLGVMIADPADLARGRATGPQDGVNAVLGVQRYNIGKVTPLNKEGTGPEAGAK